MVSNEIRIVLDRETLKKLLSSERSSISKGISSIIDEFSEKVEEDVLKNFINERR